MIVRNTDTGVIAEWANHRARDIIDLDLMDHWRVDANGVWEARGCVIEYTDSYLAAQGR